MKFKAKRGSLELSVNAIVILVMAIAVLGLGLAFVRGLIQKGQDKFTTIIASSELDNPATADKPFTLDSEISVKEGGAGKLLASFYNAETSLINITPYFQGCMNSTPDTAGTTFKEITYSTGTRMPVASGGNMAFRGAVFVGKTVPIGTYICNLAIKKTFDDGTTSNVTLTTGQFFVTVKQ